MNPVRIGVPTFTPVLSATLLPPFFYCTFNAYSFQLK